MTSWSVVFSISLMRATENFARLLICSSASRGMVPISAWTSQTAISTSSHFWNLVSSDQRAPISGSVYRSIIGDQALVLVPEITLVLLRVNSWIVLFSRVKSDPLSHTKQHETTKNTPKILFIWVICGFSI